MIYFQLILDHVLDGNSEHVAHALMKKGLSGVALDLVKRLEQIK